MNIHTNRVMGNNEETSLSAQLPILKRDKLLDLWNDLFKSSAPAAISRQLLDRAIAYTLQERLLGGLSNRMRKELLRIGQSESKGYPIKAKVGGGSELAAAKLKGSSPPKITLRPGMRLVREWQGRSHVVDVHDDGFQWNDKVYRSLSALASDITGAKWSGPRFFGL